MKRIETIEDAHDEDGEHDHHGRGVIRQLDGGAHARGLQRQGVAPEPRKVERCYSVAE
jgi:hypothetical protein